MAGRGKGRPSSGEAAAIGNAIRDAALAALTHEGPGVTMNAIVAASGLSRKSVYARYANKDALFVAVIRELMTGRDPVAFASHGTIEDRLRSYARETLRLMRAPEAIALQRLLTINPDYARALGHDIEAALDQNFAAPLRACLAAAAAAGELRIADRDRIVVAVVTLLVTEGTRAFREGIDPTADPDGRDAADADYAAFVADLLCHGVVSGGAPG